MVDLRGVLVAVTTPMNPDESLNPEYLRTKVSLLRSKGVNGVFALGTNGEVYALAQDEKITLIETVRSAVDPGMILCVNVGSPTTMQSIELARAAQSIGVDCIGVIAPYFVDVTEEQLYRHFSSVSESVAVPTILYNIPARTGNVITPSLVERLSRSSGVVGIKDSSGNIQSIRKVVAATDEDFRVFSGTDSLVLAGLQAGCVGTVSGLGNVVPEFVVGIYRAFQAGDGEVAEKFQTYLSEFRKLFSVGNASGVTKMAENFRGGRVGPSRRPAGSFSDDVAERVRTAVDRAVERIEELPANYRGPGEART